jgi:CSLREA domain-containing protein
MVPEGASAAGGGVRAKRATVAAALIVAAALSAGVAALVLAGPAWPATLTVNTASDEQNENGQCSLREAIINANQDNQPDSPGSLDCPAGVGADTIKFGLGDAPATITLAEPLPAVTDGEGLTVGTTDGAAPGAKISGAGQVRVFEVAEGAKLALKGLTVADGNGGPGGGVLNRGNLTVSGSTLSGNGAASGGGLYNSGTATVINSTLSGNSASDSGGGIHNHGQGARLEVRNSTLFDNSAGQSGGGIEHAGGSARLRNTIVADGPSGENPSGENCHWPVDGSVSRITDGGHNLSSDNTCGFSTANRSHSGVDNPKLDPFLADNGGPSPTHALLEGSLAVDKGDSFGAGADQRGLPRPTDLGEVGNARGGDGSDIGAYEMVKCSGGVVNAAGTIVGRPGRDKLSGGPGDDFIFGLGGDDTIFGGGGNDEVCSGKGNDALYGGPGDDKLLGGEGKDNLRGDGGNDRLEGLRGDDRLNADDGEKDDLVHGGSGQDRCDTDRVDVRRSCR